MVMDVTVGAQENIAQTQCTLENDTRNAICVKAASAGVALFQSAWQNYYMFTFLLQKMTRAIIIEHAICFISIVCFSMLPVL